MRADSLDWSRSRASPEVGYAHEGSLMRFYPAACGSTVSFGAVRSHSREVMRKGGRPCSHQAQSYTAGEGITQ